LIGPRVANQKRTRFVTRKYLLVVRAGDQSLHPAWLGNQATERNWDLHISYFGDQAEPFGKLSAGLSLSREKGPKYIGLAECLDKHPAFLENYSHIGFPDDDLCATCATWNRTFSALEALGADIGQPSLDHRSFFFHDVVLQRKWLKYRIVDFVEVMTPIFRTDFLKSVRPTFCYNKSSLGIDFLWRKIGGEAGRTFAVIDSCSVLHTRQIGMGTQYAKSYLGGLTPYQDYRQLLDRYQIDDTPGRALRGVRPDGRGLDDERKLNRRELYPRLLRAWKKLAGIEAMACR